MAPSPQAGYQINPVNCSQDSKASVASGGVGYQSSFCRSLMLSTPCRRSGSSSSIAHSHSRQARAPCRLYIHHRALQLCPGHRYYTQPGRPRGRAVSFHILGICPSGAWCAMCRHRSPSYACPQLDQGLQYLVNLFDRPSQPPVAASKQQPGLHLFLIRIELAALRALQLYKD